MFNRGRQPVAVIILAGLAVALAAHWFYLPESGPIETDVSEPGPRGDMPSAGNKTSSPFAVQETGPPVPVDAVALAGQHNADKTNQLPGEISESLGVIEIDPVELGKTPISDEEFESIVAQLESDPALLQILLDEYRQETDPDRLRRISQILGDVAGPDVLAVASEFVYSSDPALRSAGLELLRRIQPGNAEARDIVSGILSTETDPSALVDTLTAIASPGAVDADARAGIAEQVALLVDHDDPAVRRSSFEILSRWTDGDRHTSALLIGLGDTDESVRTTAAYAFVGHENTSSEVVQNLFSRAANEAEAEPTRRALILALKGMPLETDLRSQLADIEKMLDRRPSATQP